MLQRFDPHGRKGVDTPMAVQSGKIQSRLHTEKKETEIPYRQAIGSLLYLQNGTRPDISYATNVLSRRQACYTMSDWKAVLRVFKYLRATVNYGLTLSGKTDTIECYVDASLGTHDE
ncbi:unnamed protein product, partial [Nesidiocoris tenuis]